MYKDSDSDDYGLYDDYLPIKKEDNSEGLLSPFTYLVATLLLALFGLVTLFSASYDNAIRGGESFYSPLINQSIALIISLVIGISFSFIPLKAIRKSYFLLLPLYSIFFVLFFFFPTLLSSYSVKSSFALIGVVTILFFVSDMATIIAERERMGILLIFTILVTAFILFSLSYISGLGWYVLSSIVILSILISLRMQKTYILFYFFALLVGLIFLISAFSHLFYSVTRSVMPISSPSLYSSELYFSSLAIQEGGIKGSGIGNGLYKLGVIDGIDGEYIFASLSEETGIFGILILIFISLVILVIGIRSSNRSYNRGERYRAILIVAIVVTLVFSMLINLLYVSGLLPFEGVPLFLFSYNPFIEAVVGVLLTFLYRLIYKTCRSGE